MTGEARIGKVLCRRAGAHGDVGIGAVRTAAKLGVGRGNGPGDILRPIGAEKSAPNRLPGFRELRPPGFEIGQRGGDALVQPTLLDEASIGVRTSGL